MLLLLFPLPGQHFSMLLLVIFPPRAAFHHFTIGYFTLRAAAATKNGHFKAEIVPVTVEVEDKDGNKRTITVSSHLQHGLVIRISIYKALQKISLVWVTNETIL